MKNKLRLTITFLFLFSIILFANAAEDEEISIPKPPSQPDEPKIEVKDSRKDVEKEQDILGELEEELKKLDSQYKDSPQESPEAQSYLERIKAIKKRIREIRAKSATVRKREDSTQFNRLSPELLRKQIEKKRQDIKELEDQVAKARSHISEISKDKKEQHPEVKEVERRIRYLERKLDFDKALLKNMLNRQKEINSQKRTLKATPKKRRKVDLELRLEIFVISHVKVNYLAQIVKPFLTPKVGVIVPCTYTNSIIVRDTPKILKQAAEIIKHVDVPKEEAKEK